MRTRLRRQPEPPGGEDPEHMSVCKQNRFVRAADFGNHAIDACADVFRAFPAGATVGEDHPAGVPLVDLARRKAFVFAIVPFREVAVDHGALREAGQLAGLLGAGERARQHQVERHAREQRRQQARHPSAPLRERNIGEPGVLTAHAPFGLTVPDEKNPPHRSPRAARPSC